MTAADRSQAAFIEWADNREDHWEVFKTESWRICPPGSQREGEYANTLLQQLWEAWQAGFSSSAPPKPAAQGNGK